MMKRSIAAGGPFEQWREHRAARAMELAAQSLPTARKPAAGGLPELHFLTGRRFWYQTAFCLHTLQQQAGLVFRAHFHDDGSLGPEAAKQLGRLFPAATVHFRRESDERLAALLPPARFPTLHAERRHPYPNFLKLTDVHAGRQGWRLVLDSDMLFFSRPDLLLAWLAAPDRPIHMQDVADAYGYPTGLMDELAGTPVPPRVNVGFCGLDSSELDWERIEHWARTLIERHGTRYYLEQAISAMLCAGRDPLVLPAKDYRLLPTDAECQAPTAVLHHYVAGSKRGYFKHAWSIALNRAAQAASGP